MTRIKNTIFLTIIISTLVSCQQKTPQTLASKRTIEIKDGFYFINGNKTFISAIGYQANARPGQHPKNDKKQLFLERMTYDLQQIKEAGYNTIRTWDELTEEELQLVQQSGLYIIYGIEINQYGEWKDSAFINQAKQRVSKALTFTKNYDCVITYLIMNEPMTDHIQAQDGETALHLWKSLVDLIHVEHPGIPVSMSPNSRISEWLHESFLDVNGFNIYNYNEDQIYTQGYAGHIQFLREKNDTNKPFLITEFGLSISQNGNGLYGGNSIKMQTEHLVNDYVQVLDGGVSGACPFYYADGWWKAGKPDVHDPYAEEWFGFKGYADKNDTLGYPRPVWHEMSKYIQAIITSPRNHKIYSNRVPVELFLTKKIKEFRVIYNDQIILKQDNINTKHLETVLDFGEDKIKDRELVFEFYDAAQNLVKYETIMLLTAQIKPKLPNIAILTHDTNLNDIKTFNAKITVNNQSPFTIDNKIKYVISPHVGWEAGKNQAMRIDPNKTENTILVSFKVPDKSPVINLSVGIQIQYGKFIKQISAAQFIYRGHWADSIKIQ